jgi:uncharacterized protein DUF3540
MLLESTIYLSPGRVLETDGGRVLVGLPEAKAWAISAMGAHYRPCPGDIVLAIGNGESCYIIGIIQGTGNTIISVPADLSLIVPNGSVNIVAARGVNVRSERIKLHASSIEIIARSLFEKAGTAYKWVKEGLNLRLGRLRARIKGTYDIGADRIVEKAKGGVTIDGSSINLG